MDFFAVYDISKVLLLAVAGSRFIITHDVRYIRPMYLTVVVLLIGKQIYGLLN